jgi:NAD+ diphosphatase
MLQIPVSFIPLHIPQRRDNAHSFIFRGDELLVHATDLSLPGAPVCAALGIDPATVHPVGLWEQQYFHTAWVARDTVPGMGYEFIKLRSLFGVLDESLLSIAGRAYQIAEWARTHRYCGACGSATAALEGERCLKCPSCGLTAYPRISPAMMVLVKKGDAILLARHATTARARFTALAGFLEPGESVEDAVHREVYEEVGLKIHNLRYFGSQSWPFPHSLMIAFTAEYLSGDITVDHNEIAEARWFGPGDALPEVATGISISGALIAANLPKG